MKETKPPSVQEEYEYFAKRFSAALGVDPGTKDLTVVATIPAHVNKNGDVFPYGISMIQKVLPTLVTQDALQRQMEEFYRMSKKLPTDVVKKQLSMHEEELETERVAVAAKPFYPGHCKRCGHSMGCMCPRVGEEPKPTPCKHYTLIRIPNHRMAVELGVEEAVLCGPQAVYVCLDCGTVIQVSL